MNKLTNRWNKEANKLLLNRRIVKVEYLDDDEAKESGWYNRPVAFKLDKGDWVYPMRDDEGNDGGALAIGKELLPVLTIGD